MTYPNDFETPAYPAGRGIAISRAMAIWTLAAFLVIVFLCGLLVWSGRSDKLIPYMISANSDDWKIVGKVDNEIKLSREFTIQESLIANFIGDWFDKTRWKKCERTQCVSDTDIFACALYCNTTDEMHAKHIAPENIKITNVKIMPTGAISDVGGSWRIDTDEIIAFVKVARHESYYPKTMGFYVADFNAYKK